MKPMLARTYETQNVEGWLMSEKLDGCRAIWTGSELLSRNGNKFFAPDWFTAQLPSGVMLDGELYIGRNAFQHGVSVIRKKNPIDAEWQTIRYCVFDAPECKGGFETRIAFCGEILAGCGIAEVVEQTVCKSDSHLQEFFSGLVALGAEGVMLRRPGSEYEQRRSDSLLKFKPFGSDEAEVIGHQAGEGKHLDRLGALICRWQNVVFNLGTGFSDALREAPPQIGAQVSFMFQGLTDGGVPRFPVFLAERNYE
jgi:DNA ligase-1